MQAKVLIAESDPVSSEMLTGIVQMANAIPLTTSSLKACREMAVRERPQVAICADELPDGSGIDLVQFLRQLDEGIETVLLSRNTAVRVVENAIDEGIADFLAKPFLPKDFRDCLTRLLRRSEARVRVTDESSPKNVLLVANDQLAIGRIQKLVSQVGMTTHLAGDMPAAQRQLALPGIDILLLDQELESDAEVTMLEDLAYRYRAVRIVVMTTSRNPETLLSVLRRTDVNLLLKPFNRVRFYREVLSSRQSRSDNLWAPQGAEAAAPQPEPEPEPEPPPPVPPPHSPDLEELSPAVQAWLVSAPEPQVVREAQHIHEHQAEHVRDDFTERIRELERELQ
jgi:DNA-binding NtrC family response regulator